MPKINGKSAIGLILFNLCLPSIHAASNNLNTNFIDLFQSSFVTSLSVGLSSESAGQAQTLNLAPGITKTYTANKPTSTLPIGELFLGIKNVFPNQLEGQIGFAGVLTGSATLSGDIFDDSDPYFNNYKYQYKISHQAILIKGKLLAHWNLPVVPWISVSLGAGLNKAHDFNNTPTLSEALPSPNFNDNTVTAFTYTIGIGIQRQLSPHWQAGLGYEFADWGRSQLGSVAGESTNQSLSLSHLYTHSILFNLTYAA